MVIINANADEDPVRIVENFTDVGATIIWMMEIPTPVEDQQENDPIN